jgi:hypothetical protein
MGLALVLLLAFFLLISISSHGGSSPGTGDQNTEFNLLLRQNGCFNPTLIALPKLRLLPHQLAQYAKMYL